METRLRSGVHSVARDQLTLRPFPLDLALPCHHTGICVYNNHTIQPWGVFHKCHAHRRIIGACHTLVTRQLQRQLSHAACTQLHRAKRLSSSLLLSISWLSQLGRRSTATASLASVPRLPRPVLPETHPPYVRSNYFLCTGTDMVEHMRSISGSSGHYYRLLLGKQRPPK